MSPVLDIAAGFLLADYVRTFVMQGFLAAEEDRREGYKNPVATAVGYICTLGAAAFVIWRVIADG